MAETVGSIIDKLCINKLKIYHMRDRWQFTEDTGEKKSFEEKLGILHTQGDDLGNELQELLEDLASGKKQLKVYRQYKI